MTTSGDILLLVASDCIEKFAPPPVQEVAPLGATLSVKQLIKIELYHRISTTFLILRALSHEVTLLTTFKEICLAITLFTGVSNDFIVTHYLGTGPV